MGEVYRARDPRLGRDVAIKALPSEFAQDRERLARFEREARLLASLSHPNVAGIHGVEVVSGTPYLVLELVEGATLAARLAGGPLPLDEALEVARQVAAGVEAAHERGVVHRDLKPGNVMLTPAGAVKVLDFGLARGPVDPPPPGSDLSASPTVTLAATRAGSILGTASYMSPEQARGRPVDKRTDIWAFGCILYECLTGRQAWGGETASDVIARILKEQPDWSALPPSTPPRVTTLLSRCLEKDAMERLRDIGEARIALATPIGETSAPARAGGVPWWAAAAFAFGLAAFAALVALRLAPGPPPAPLRRLDLATGDLDVSWVDGPQLSPDGSKFAFVSKNRIWVRDLDALAPRAVADITSMTSIGWSPDSRILAFDASHKLWKVPAEGGRPVAVCDLPGTGAAVGLGWSRNGKIAFAAWRGGLYQVADGGGAPELLVDIDPATMVDFHYPSWLANGDLLYLTHWKSDAEAQGRAQPVLYAFDGKRSFAVDAGGGAIDDQPMVTPTGRLVWHSREPNVGAWTAPYDLAGRRVSGPAVLVAPDAQWLSLSAEGSLLYVEGSNKDSPLELVWMDRSGNAVQVPGQAHPGLALPAIAPDGRHIAFGATDENSADVWVRDLARGTDLRLTFDAGFDRAPAWLGSSSRLVYLERMDMAGRIVAVNADGSGAQAEFAPAAGLGSVDTSVTLTSDGKWGVRLVDERGLGKLRLAPVLPGGTLGTLEPLLKTQPEPDVVDARVSPEGKLVAYVVNNPGQSDVFLSRFPDGTGRWQVGSAGGRMARWSRDGRELFYISGSGPAPRHLVAVKVDPSQDPPLGASATLFELPDTLQDVATRGFDVAADGARFLFIRPVGGASAAARRLVLVQNWEAGLDR
jgi:Tol biopolymer transport system component